MWCERLTSKMLHVQDSVKGTACAGFERSGSKVWGEEAERGLVISCDDSIQHIGESTVWR